MTRSDHRDAFLRGLAQLDALLATRLAPPMAELVHRQFADMFENPAVPVDVATHALESALSQYRAMHAQVTPFDARILRGMLEVAPRKLTGVLSRAARGLPVRGIDPNDVVALTSHAESLAQGQAGGTPAAVAAWAVGVAYQNHLLYARHLIVGEVHNRNVVAPLGRLAEAARDLRIAPDVVPWALVPDVGLLCTTDAPSNASLQAPWTPAGLVLVDGDTHPQPIDDIPGMADLVTRMSLPVSPLSLAALVHVLCSLFPWDSRLVFSDDERRRWDRAAGEESRAEDLGLAGASSSAVHALLGVSPPAGPEDWESLVFRVTSASTGRTWEVDYAQGALAYSEV